MRCSMYYTLLAFLALVFVNCDTVGAATSTPSVDNSTAVTADSTAIPNGATLNGYTDWLQAYRAYYQVLGRSATPSTQRAMDNYAYQALANRAAYLKDPSTGSQFLQGVLALVPFGQTINMRVVAGKYARNAAQAFGLDTKGAYDSVKDEYWSALGKKYLQGAFITLITLPFSFTGLPLLTSFAKSFRGVHNMDKMVDKIQADMHAQAKVFHIQTIVPLVMAGA